VKNIGEIENWKSKFYYQFNQNSTSEKNARIYFQRGKWLVFTSTFHDCI